MFYYQLYDAYSVDRVPSDYPQAVIDFGAGVGPCENTLQMKQIQALFEPIPNIFFLLPPPDTMESLKILRERDISPPADLTFNINAHFMKHPRYQMLAKHIIYTHSKTPEQTCAEVIKILG
jgi:hypothetical protein